MVGFTFTNPVAIFGITNDCAHSNIFDCAHSNIFAKQRKYQP
jgi:hypothetical protein